MMEALATMTLDGFVGHWLKDAPICPPAVPYERVASNIGVTLYRDDRFQVQLWTFAPHSEIADHSHPDVDSWVVWVGGDYCFRKNGRMVERPDMKFVRWRGVTVPKLHLAPGDLHGATIGETGGSFLSISERLNGQPPVSVHLAWDGPALDAEHAGRLKARPITGNSDFSYQVETFAEAMEAGGEAFGARQYGEAGEIEAGPFVLDRRSYEAAEQAGKLRVFTVRHQGEMVGFASCFVFFGVHASTTKAALGDAFGVAPEYRRPTVAVRLVTFAEEQLRAEGVGVIHWNTNDKHPAAARLLERLGYKPVSRTLAKVLNNA